MENNTANFFRFIIHIVGAQYKKLLQNNADFKIDYMKNNDIVVIASFPPRGFTHHKAVVGAASYTKNTLNSIKAVIDKEKTNITLNVLADQLGYKTLEYKDQGILVKRVWRRGSFYTFVNIVKSIIFNHPKTKKILIEFELGMFGDRLHIVLFLAFIFFLRLIKKEVIIVLHQVVTDLNPLYGHVNIKKYSLKIKLYNFAMKNFYKLVLILSSKIIVFDELLRRKLEDLQIGKHAPIFIIPHGVEKFNRLNNKSKARIKLGISSRKYVVLLFGFIAWYKGTDWLTKEFAKIAKSEKDIVLIIAGGPNPNHLDKKYYLDYIKKIKQLSEKSQTLITGFVDEKDIPLYYEASDLVIFPYRVFMSASGPLSITYSFQKPFLISRNLEGIFDTQDAKKILNKIGIDKNNLVFGFNNQLQTKLEKIRKDKSLNKKLILFSKELAKERSWVNVGRKYYNEIFI